VNFKIVLNKDKEENLGLSAIFTFSADSESEEDLNHFFLKTKSRLSGSTSPYAAFSRLI